jgi:uncharacterized protein (DUF488 family)
VERGLNLKLFTIGFTKKTAETFFSRLKQAGVRKVIDTRLWPDTQLSGFARKKDLPYFLRNLAAMDYEHHLSLAPDKPLLQDHKDGKINWAQYETRYLELLKQRRIAEKFLPQEFSDCCFLCAEHKPEHCHRRLLVEYLQKEWPENTIEIVHL